MTRSHSSEPNPNIRVQAESKARDETKMELKAVTKALEIQRTRAEKAESMLEKQKPAP